MPMQAPPYVRQYPPQQTAMRYMPQPTRPKSGTKPILVVIVLVAVIAAVCAIGIPLATRRGMQGPSAPDPAASAMAGEDPFSGKFVMDGSEYQLLKTKVSDLAASGWKPGDDIDDTQWIMGRNLVARKSTIVALKNPDYGANLEVWVANQTDADMPVDDCPITAIYVEATKGVTSGSFANGDFEAHVFDASFPSLTIAGGAHLGMSYEDYVSAYGNPDKVEKKDTGGKPTTYTDHFKTEGGYEKTIHCAFGGEDPKAPLKFAFYEFDIPES